MSYWGENIRFLRKQAGLSQDALATALGMTRVKLNAHESAKTTNPTTSDLVAASDYFNIGIDQLLRTKLSEGKPNEPVFVGQKDLRVLAITVDAVNEEYIDYVPVKAKAGYLAGHRDPDYMAALPKYRFPDLPKGKTFRLFPTTGDSMVPIPEGSDVLASFVEDWKQIKPCTLCIVVLRSGQDFVFKQVTLTGKKLHLESLNGQYQPYQVNLEDVLEIWKFDRFISRQVPAHPNELEEIKSLLLDMKRELNLKNKRSFPDGQTAM